MNGTKTSRAEIRITGKCLIIADGTALSPASRNQFTQRLVQRYVHDLHRSGGTRFLLSGGLAIEWPTTPIPPGFCRTDLPDILKRIATLQGGGKSEAMPSA
jgi:hypothetical protein